MKTKRITLTLPESIINEINSVSGGHICRFVSEALEQHLIDRRKQVIREELIAGCVANAEEDLLICNESDAVNTDLGAHSA